MDDYWNTSEINSSTLDNFFDDEDESPGAWSVVESSILSNVQSSQDKFAVSSSKENIKSSSSTGKLSGILDNISIGSDSNTSGNSGSKVKDVGKSIGEKIETWKAPSVSIKWKSDGSQVCLTCSAKDEEICLLKSKLERAVSRYNVTLLPSDTIDKMILGLQFSLENYRRLDEKVQLLQAALNSNDSSAILAVVVFMKNSMKKNLFYKELQNYPSAAQLYVHYLKQRNENVEALDLLGMLGKTEEAAMLKYELAVASPCDSQLKNMKNAQKTHFQDSSLSFEAKMVNQHVSLLEHQVSIETSDDKDKNNPTLIEYPRATSLIGQSPLTTLFYCSMYHWHNAESNTASPLYLKRSFDISDKLFLWTVVRARAKVKHWALPVELENSLGSKGFISTLSHLSGRSGGGKMVKNTLPIDLVVDFLASSGAQPNILYSYIDLLSSYEEKLRLGKEYNCHQAVIDAYVGLKDRGALEEYLKYLTFGSSEYFKAEQALKNIK